MRIRYASIVVTAMLVVACARHPTPAPAAVPEGTLSFARADSLADSAAGSRVAALGGEGTVTVVLASASGCDVVTPSGRYAVDGGQIRVTVSGVRRVMVCHDPAPARPRAFAATIRGLSSGTYELAVDFAGDNPTWTPLRREVRVR